jgi:hypothetical protein
VAIAAATDVKSRRMRASEIAEAAKVFGDTLPIDRIRVTNLQKRASGASPAADITMVNAIDNTIIIGMGDQFDADLIGNQTFIHELTHAWQIEHDAFSIEEIVGDIERPLLSSAQEGELYRTYVDGRPWSQFKSEGQAVVVETWYSSHHTDLTSAAAQSDIWFPYIARNIRMGQP